jgi:hypothetical protein
MLAAESPATNVFKILVEDSPTGELSLHQSRETQLLPSAFSITVRNYLAEALLYSESDLLTLEMRSRRDQLLIYVIDLQVPFAGDKPTRSVPG